MYNDDQIASPEIIEKMARAYKKESKYNNEEMILATVKRQSKKSLFKDGGNVFNWLVDCIKILDFIIGKNKKN